MEPIITKQQVSALLGRSLTTVEDTNFNLYLKIAVERLEDLLCITLTSPLPEGLQLLLARCFATIGLEQLQTASNGVKSKKVEDFDITYADNAMEPMEAFVKQNENALEQYSECQASIRQGKVCDGNRIRLFWLR